MGFRFFSAMSIALMFLTLFSRAQQPQPAARVARSPAQPKAAQSQGNDQETSTLNVTPTDSPFCNSTESDRRDTTRPNEVKQISALLGPGVCSESADSNVWDLAADPSVHEPFRIDSAWNKDVKIWQNTSNVCLAGKADIVLERSFRYGFCDANSRNIDAVNVPSSSFSLDDADYYILNIVVWANDGSRYSVSSSKWYVYNHGDHGKWYRQPISAFSNPLRIYGTKKPIGFVAIHIRPKTVSWKDFKQLKVRYDIAVKGKTPANVTNFLTALEVIGKGAGVAGAKSDPDGFYGATFFKAKTPSDISFNAQVDFPKVQAAGLDSGNDLIRGKRYAPAAAEIEAAYHVDQTHPPTASISTILNEAAHGTRSHEIMPTTSVVVGSTQNTNPGGVTASGGGQSTNNSGTNPSSTSGNQNQKPAGPSADCPAQTSGGQQAACKFAATVDDEDLYHWDISFAVPFHALNDLTFLASDGTGNTVIPKTVTRLNAYALFEFFPVAADIKTPPPIAVPHIFAGLPISGKVFNKPIFGAGDTFNLKKIVKVIPLQVGFFGGVVYNKEFRQIPGTIGSANVEPHRVWKGTYGVEIPVSQFKSLLSSNKSQGSTPSSQKAASTGSGK
jgi:hypothetical protein